MSLFVVGAITVVFVAWLWGSWSPPAIWHDEAAYILQAKIFASGKWAEAPPPIPEFFEQYHVLVTPSFAAKYPPGHAMLLALGAAAGAVIAVPLALTAVTGMAIFTLTRQVGGTAAAWLSWALWLVAPINLAYRPSYLSVITTGTLWVLGWLALLRWWRSGRGSWLVMVAVLGGYCAITRPLTAVAFVLPMAVPVLANLRRTGQWRQLSVACGVGALMVGVLPLWSRYTTGAWGDSPVVLYTRMYMPWDKVGFGLDSTHRARVGQADLDAFSESFRDLHRQHTVQRVPLAAGKRVLILLFAAYGWAWPLLVPLALWGMTQAPKEVRFALASTASLVLFYLLYAHPLAWNAYYLEVAPVLAFLPAWGIRCAWLRCRVLWSERVVPIRRLTRPLVVGLWVGVAVCVPLSAVERVASHVHATAVREYHGRFVARVNELPESAVIVFVRYAAGHDPNRNLVVNEPDWRHSKAWVVHDRGADNRRLMALAPERAAYLFDEQSNTMTPISRSGPLESIAR